MHDLIMKTKIKNMGEQSIESYTLPANATFASPVKYVGYGFLHVTDCGEYFYKTKLNEDAISWYHRGETLLSVIPLYRRENCE